MLIFVDFETDGLEGNVLEACAVDENLQILQKIEGGKDLEKFFKEILGEDNIIIFWHHFMPIYLHSHFIEVFNFLEGKFITFTDIFSFTKGVQKRRYKIAEITKELIDKEHQGTAESDAKDLCLCFKALKNKIN